jgi:TRAP-type C4-dicarboxylate transport system permease large subunit
MPTTSGVTQIVDAVAANLFVIQGITGEPISAISRAVMPLLIIMLLFAPLLALLPELALYLPSKVSLRG